MTTEKATIIVEGTFREGYEIYFKQYSMRIETFLQQFNATIIRRQLIEDTLYGQEHPSLIMLIDFPDKEIASKIFFSTEYLSILPLRDKIFKTFKMYLARFGDV
jgi:uncharacterized protein (DUF1330 family)